MDLDPFASPRCAVFQRQTPEAECTCRESTPILPDRPTPRGAAIRMGALSSRLVSVTRTRTYHPDGRAENVAEHTLMLVKIAPVLASMLRPELDAGKVALYASLHDDVEVYCGDTPTDWLAQHDEAAKQAREQAAADRILNEYAWAAPYAALFAEYEAQAIPEARFVRAVDKLTTLLIHFPNGGEILRSNYASSEEFLQAEAALLNRDRHKYGEFTEVMALRAGIGARLARITWAPPAPAANGGAA